jgi:hypothetical protein
MGHMYIRHAVGSLLLWDSIKHNCGYSIEQIAGYWNIVNDKTWYYSKQSEVKYDKAERAITIVTDVQTNYIV